MAAFVLISCSGEPKPKDAELLEDFQRSKPELSRLLQMLREDRSLRILSISRPPDPPIDKNRLNEYQNTMLRARIENIFVNRGKGGGALPEDQTVKFRIDNGLSFYHAKGYFYSERKPRSLRESLDLTKNDVPVPPYQTHYKHIEGNWYLYVESLTD